MGSSEVDGPTPTLSRTSQWQPFLFACLLWASLSILLLQADSNLRPATLQEFSWTPAPNWDRRDTQPCGLIILGLCVLRLYPLSQSNKLRVPVPLIHLPKPLKPTERTCTQ